MTHTILFFTDLGIVRDLASEGVRGYQLQEEVCGFVVLSQNEKSDYQWKTSLMEVMNEEPKASRRTHFSFDFPVAIRFLIEQRLVPLAIYHTHLFASPNLSGSDVRTMTKTGLDMVVISLASNEVRHYTKMQQSFPCIESTTLNLMETPYVTTT